MALLSFLCSLGSYWCPVHSLCCATPYPRGVPAPMLLPIIKAYLSYGPLPHALLQSSTWPWKPPGHGLVLVSGLLGTGPQRPAAVKQVKLHLY